MGIKAFNHGDDFVNKFVRLSKDSTGKDAVTPAPVVAGTGLSATGGIISEYSDGGTFYRAHVFTTSGAFQVTALSTDSSLGDTIDALVVGGGGGGAYTGAGGGAGGLVEATPILLQLELTQLLWVVAEAQQGDNGEKGNTGSPAVFNNPGSTPQTITALGGGGGSSGGSPGSLPTGGSGAGGGTANSPRVAQQPSQNPGIPNLTNYGSDGGDGWGPSNGGGGGAGGAGGSPGPGNNSVIGGAGGAGRANVYAYGHQIRYLRKWWIWWI